VLWFKGMKSRNFQCFSIVDDFCKFEKVFIPSNSMEYSPLGKLIVIQLVNKFTISYGTQRFITVFVRACQYSFRKVHRFYIGEVKTACQCKINLPLLINCSLLTVIAY